MRTWLGTRAQLQLEILALRHQVTVLQRPRKARAPLTSFDREFWVWLYRLWPGCLNALVIVTPETVVRWLSFLITSSAAEILAFQPTAGYRL